MRNYIHVIWGLMALLVIGAFGPAHADRDKGGDDRGGNRIRVIINGRDSDEDDRRSFQQWYSVQVRGYDEIDRETGECVSDLAQMVMDVTGNRLTVVDRQYDRHTVMLTKNTQTIFQSSQRSWTPPGQRRHGDYSQSAQRAGRIREGDLVIVHGYLHASGGLIATRIRVIGTTDSGKYDDDTDTKVGYGYRIWGEVRTIDLRNERLDISTNLGRRTIVLSRDAELRTTGDRRISLRELRAGDRVIVYTWRQDGTVLTAYRLAVLSRTDRYPEGDRPYCTDPDYGKNPGTHQDDRDDEADLLRMEGRVVSVHNQLLMNKLVVEDARDREYSFRASKVMTAVRPDGSRVAMTSLRAGERVRVTYYEENDTFFVDKIEVL